MEDHTVSNEVDVAESKPDSKNRDAQGDDSAKSAAQQNRPKEVGGRDGPDPTRYGDWEKGGRCIDF